MRHHPLRNMFITSGLCFACACTPIGDDSSPDASILDAGDVSDAPDAPDTSPAEFEPRCEELRDDYIAALNASSTCATDDDCMVIEGSGSCDCTFSWGNASGDFVNQDFAYPDGWTQRVEACADYIADSSRECDAAPAQNIRCEAGTCTGDSLSCLDGD